MFESPRGISENDHGRESGSTFGRLNFLDFFRAVGPVVIHPTEKKLGATEFYNVVVIDSAVRHFYLVYVNISFGSL
jgi:hypothetical protein